MATPKVEPLTPSDLLKIIQHRYTTRKVNKIPFPEVITLAEGNSAIQTVMDQTNFSAEDIQSLLQLFDMLILTAPDAVIVFTKLIQQKCITGIRPMTSTEYRAFYGRIAMSMFVGMIRKKTQDWNYLLTALKDTPLYETASWLNHAIQQQQ
jgi:hypothetical protein